jgi:hypothetical protein
MKKLLRRIPFILMVASTIAAIKYALHWQDQYYALEARSATLSSKDQA